MFVREEKTLNNVLLCEEPNFHRKANGNYAFFLKRPFAVFQFNLCGPCKTRKMTMIVTVAPYKYPCDMFIIIKAFCCYFNLNYSVYIHFSQARIYNMY